MKLKYDVPLSNSAFKSNLRRYTQPASRPPLARPPVRRAADTDMGSGSGSGGISGIRMAELRVEIPPHSPGNPLVRAYTRPRFS